MFAALANGVFANGVFILAIADKVVEVLTKTLGG